MNDDGRVPPPPPSPSVSRRLRHDLRSPLAVVIGRADLLLAEVHGPLNDDQRRSVEVILEAAARLQRDLEALAEEIDPRPDDDGGGAG